MILVVEPDQQGSIALLAALSGEPTTRADGFVSGTKWIRDGLSPSFLIVGLPLPDGPWDALIEECRARAPSTPVLLLANDVDAGVVRRAFALEATLTCRPVDVAELQRFVRRRLAAPIVAPLPDALRVAVEAMVAKYELREHQVRLLVHAVEGRARKEVARELSLSENTVKSQIRDLLKKCGAPSLVALCREAFDHALSGARGHANRQPERAPTPSGARGVRV